MLFISALFTVLLAFLVANATQIPQHGIRCRICKRLQSQVNSIPQSRLRLLPHVLNFFANANKHEDICIEPCSKYSPNITCSLCTFLLDVGEAWKGQQEADFKERLEYSCTTLDFMYPLCKMIVSESSHQLYLFIANGVDHRKGCEQLQLCLPD